MLQSQINLIYDTFIKFTNILLEINNQNGNNLLLNNKENKQFTNVLSNSINFIVLVFKMVYKIF